MLSLNFSINLLKAFNESHFMGRGSAGVSHHRIHIQRKMDYYKKTLVTFGALRAHTSIPSLEVMVICAVLG